MSAELPGKQEGSRGLRPSRPVPLGPLQPQWSTCPACAQASQFWRPVLLQPHCQQTACSTAPPPGPCRRCTTCTHSLAAEAFIHEDFLEPAVTPHEAQPPARQSSASCGLLGGRGSVRFWCLLCGFSFLGQSQINNPSPRLSGSRKGRHSGEAPVSSLQQLRHLQWAWPQEPRSDGGVAKSLHFLLAVVPLSLVHPLLPDGLF